MKKQNNKQRILLICASFIMALTIATPLSAKQFTALVFTKTAGWQHDSIPAAVSAVNYLSQLHDFSAVHTSDANAFTSENLDQFDVVVFLLTTGDVLNEQQQSDFQKFIHSGKGYVGVHSAADTEYGWPWYQGLVGRNFVTHPAVQSAKVNVLDPGFPGSEHMPSRFLWTEEYYNYGPEHSDSLNYLLSVDESTYQPQAEWDEVKSSGMGDFHPLAWYQEYDGGRAFYTGFGHLSTSYTNPMFLSHLYGGIYWAATGKGIEQ
ncbi:ThuA domain-containing protein [Microbulbifer agarilyticus]|uniref:ThuA domain-containing protein n=1 Tax=Microbulbifer agarilyticus TaxID=260552 RepID=UPI001CD81080|nr:ThuA domain-containing protein [Microbulbifer agarilyticus]MCA0900953.1 ThuA domain-containing protein [Microbulbifer agarilyticus]